MVVVLFGGGTLRCVTRKQCIHIYDDIISVENLLLAWREFVKGKRQKEDVQAFQFHLFENIQTLHFELKNKTYTHGPYHAFNISDPKPRNIHKALVRDRVAHHALYKILYPFFDRMFISDSYSCRKMKGTHRALTRFESFAYKVSKNNTRTCWVLKCDIRKFFASIDQNILMEIVQRHISDLDTVWLIQRVVESFESTGKGTGLPLGNLTSQLLVNVYMNEFDQFVKQTLKVQYYIRYADDFVFLSEDKRYLEGLLPWLAQFLEEKLRLTLHPHKVSLTTLASGVDFLGWVHFPTHRVLRTATKKRMLRNLTSQHDTEKKEAIKTSYVGMLGWGNTHDLQKAISSL